jgi:hypothetical protein
VRWQLVGGISGAAAVITAGAFLANNNFGGILSRTEFDGRLEQMLERSRDWVLGNNDASTEDQQRRAGELIGNSALIMMVDDSARLSRDPALRNGVTEYFNVYPLTAWSRMVDPGRPFKAPTNEEFKTLADYQRWFLWALAPDKIALSPQEKADLDSPDRMGRGRLTHQLMAWVLYRQNNGSAPQVEALIDHLARRVAGEAAIDFRMTDMYLQRVAFLLHAGRPDLVRPRWVERIMSGQQNDGGWTWAWYGWGPPFFQLRVPEETSSAHPSAQGLWIAYMLKYRYQDWVARHYH